MKLYYWQPIVFIIAGLSLWTLVIYADIMDPLARILFCIPIAVALLSMAWSMWSISRQHTAMKMRAICRDMEQQNRIADLQHCFLDTLIAMDLGLQRCSHLADSRNRALMDELDYLQEGIRELKRTTLETPGKDYWLSPLV